MNIYEEIVFEVRVGYLASLENNQPRVRPMSFVWRPGGILWSNTYSISGKMKEFLQNEKVEVCFMDAKYRQLRVEGRIDTTGGEEKKSELLTLHEGARKHFGKADAEYFTHLEIVPTRVRWKEAGFSEYEELQIEDC